MYANLIKEMALSNITMNDIAGFLEIHRNSVSNKVKGGSFSIDEAMRIHEKYFSHVDMQYLFEKNKRTLAPAGEPGEER
jgi:plasmid maintenance system antidote protein VapI